MGGMCKLFWRGWLKFNEIRLSVARKHLWFIAGHMPPPGHVLAGRTALNHMRRCLEDIEHYEALCREAREKLGDVGKRFP